MARILVALSGGVDSAVAALTLQSLGWEPIGIHLRLFDSDPESIAEGVCCGDQAAFDARLVANWLGIPFYVRDLREEDRKSTRLNSSHVKISYAVFCLKKKKTLSE